MAEAHIILLIVFPYQCTAKQFIAPFKADYYSNSKFDLNHDLTTSHS